MWKKFAIFPILLTLLLLVGFAVIKDLESSYSHLSQEQINDFLKKEDIKPLIIKDINKYTVILYETEEKIGDYSLTINKLGHTNTSVGWGNNNSDIVPVSIGQRTTFLQGAGEINYITIIINDDTILKNASMLKISFVNGLFIKEEINKDKALIIPVDTEENVSITSPFHGRMNNAIVYGRDGKELFNLKNWGRK